MDEKDFPFRKEDGVDFHQVCLSMTAVGLKTAREKHPGPDVEITSLKGKWEAYHLIAYASEVKSRVAKQALEKAYKDKKLTFKIVQSIPSYGGEWMLKNRRMSLKV